MDLLIKMLLAPIVQLLIVSLITGLMLWRRQRVSRRLLAAPLLFLWCITCRPLADLIATPLELAYPPFSQQQVRHIVVLGCGHAEASYLPLSSQPESCSIARLVEAAQIWQAQQSAIIHLSGSISDRRMAHTELEQKFLVALGIPATAIRRHDLATDTEGEIALLVHAVPTNEPLALVTSAMHMPRAMRWFATYQRVPVPAPTDYRLRQTYADSQWRVWLPHLNATETLGHAYYEYAGLLEQWIKISF